MNRPNNHRPTTTTAAPAPADTPSRRSRMKESGLVKAVSMLLFVSVTILAVSLIWFVVIGKPNNESQQVDSSKLQAVFLTGGQVYFGHIKDLNNDYVQLQDIYYLRVNQQVQPDSETTDANATPVLVPLGCELHRPQNEMLINRDQVIFWENLKDDQPENTVPGAVKKFLADNPNGQTCDTTTTDKE